MDSLEKRIIQSIDTFVTDMYKGHGASSKKIAKEILAMLPPWVAKSDTMDEASRTCNLCKGKDICRIKNTIVTDLEGYVAMKFLFKDFDDIMADLAAICNNFSDEEGT